MIVVAVAVTVAVDAVVVLAVVFLFYCCIVCCCIACRRPHRTLCVAIFSGPVNFYVITVY